jgi:hypothetical protein
MVNDGPGEKSWGRGGIGCHVATIVVVEAADPHLADPAFCLVAVCSCLTLLSPPSPNPSHASSLPR